MNPPAQNPGGAFCVGHAVGVLTDAARTDPEAGDPSQSSLELTMRTHIKVVAIINIIMGAVGVLSALGTVVGGSLGSIMSGQLIGAIAGVAGSLLFGILFGCLALLRVMAGFGLMKGAEWARFSVIVLSVLGLFNFPIGTIFGVYALWVLLSADGKREFTTVSV